MKGIFSKSGINKKDIPSGKMDRRVILGPGGNQPQSQAVVSPTTSRVVNSFIPTSSHYNGHMNGNGNPGKQIPNGSMQGMQHSQQQLSNGIMQQQQQQGQQMGNGVSHHHNGNNFYSNIPGSTGARQENHYTNYQQQSIHQSHSSSHSQQIQQRTLTKSYSNSQQSHSLYANSNNAIANHSSTAYYGNTTNLTNGAIIISHHGSEKNNHQSQNQNHHTAEGIGQVNPYAQNHDQIHPHQHQQMHKVHMQMQQQMQAQQNHRVQNQSQQNSNNPNLVNNIIDNPNNTLPLTLVQSMRTLFDILDDSKQGKIRLSDIETRWDNDANNSPNGKNSGAEPLIKMGVLEYLKKVTPVDGLLNFENFCAGLALFTNTNEVSEESEKIQHQRQAQNQQHNPPPQQYFQEHVRNLTNTNKSMKSQQNQQTVPPPPPIYNGNNSHGHLTVKSNSAVQLPSSGQSNTIHRLSKIPNFSSSRLPMPSSISNQSGIPPSPNNRINSGTMPINGSRTIPLHHPHSTLIGNSRRYHMNSEQGTTVALVHPQPPPNPKPMNNSSTINGGFVQNSITLGNSNKGNKQMSSNMNGGFQNRYSSKNSSLDDLQVPNEESMNLNAMQKERPPSAPILDNDSDENNHHHHHHQHHHRSNNEHQQSNKQKLRERAKSQERDRVVNMNHNNHSNNNNSSHNHSSRAEEKSNFAKSRQRTLSMPQLQLNKLKTNKSGVNFDESSSQEKVNTSSTENSYPKPSALKNSGQSLSKFLNSSHTNSGSSIPTISSANNSLNKHSRGDSSQNSTLSSSDLNNSRNEKENKDLPPPPPKPPRNAMNGPVTISTTLVSGVTHEPPLSGSSFGSNQTQSSSTTLSLNTSSSSGSGENTAVNTSPAKPEIRNVLNSWQKNMTDKKPVKPSLSVTSIGTNSSINTNETNKSAPPNSVVIMNNGNGISNTTADRAKLSNGPIIVKGNNNTTTSDEVKMRQPTKSNLKRKETARRHTVQAGIGIDLSTLKTIKQLEQERDILQQGLTYLEKANEWYLKQLDTSTDKIGMLSKGAPSAEYWSESHEERLNLLGCRISEVNSLLTALMDGSSQLPMHMNLQIPSHLSLRTITRLKDQNRQLTQEVSDYSHRVTQLENEKAMLLRQLFHQKNASTSDETVYM